MMMAWWHYLLLSNLYLILFFGFYVLLLQRETFFQLNRIYLVGSAVMSFIIPLLQPGWVQQWFITQKVQQTVYSSGRGVVYHFSNVQPLPLTLGQVVSYVYLAGVALLLIKFMWQLFLLNRAIRTRQAAAAWSLFKKIKVDEQLENYNVIVAHEKVHARQWHSADVMLIELVMILNWFNPVVYFYRRAIKYIHEFIADHHALKAGASRAEYSLMLLSQTFSVPTHHLLNPFWRGSMLKNRIKMLQKNRSNHVALVKYGFSAPLFALMLALSAGTVYNSKVVIKLKKGAAQMFSKAAPVISRRVLREGIAITTRAAPALQAIKPQYKVSTTSLTEPAILLPKRDIIPGDSTNAVVSNKVLQPIEEQPEFTGNNAMFYRYSPGSQNYNTRIIKYNNQGKSIATFVIEKNDAPTDVKTINSNSLAMAEGAVKVVVASPNEVQNGKPVSMRYALPIAFAADGGSLPAESGVRKLPARVQVLFAKRNTIADSSQTASASVENNIIIHPTKVFGGSTEKPLVILDGKETPYHTLATLNPQRIATISILKNDAAKAYGNTTQNGVLLITTKK